MGMDWSYLVSIAVFALAMTGTPGPNNVMLTASGANFGYKRSIPHFIGIAVGLNTLIILSAAGLDVLFNVYPAAHTTLKVAGCSYLLYLSWKIATASQTSDSLLVDEKAGTPMTLMQAALFQFLNPKAWMMSVAAIGTFTLTGVDYWLSVVAICTVFVFVQIQTSSVWVGFGAFIRRWLATPKSQARFNYLMAALTSSCVVFIW
jgi:threonine/homoserine/homoserine lactone efflux protein